MKLKDALLDLIYPPRCVFCHKLTESGVSVCPRCRRELPLLSDPELRENIPHIARCIAPLRYEGDVRQSLLRYKFHGLRGYAGVYGKILSKSIDEKGIFCDIITWVPLSRRRLRKRGYDQAGLLAAEVSAHTGIPCVKLLEKTRNNPAQSGTGSPARRRANVKGIYRVKDPSLSEGKTVLLIDDIVTTGATLSECAKMLRDSGALLVYGAALACGKDQL